MLTSRQINLGRPANLANPFNANRTAWWKVLRSSPYYGGPYLQDLIGATKGNRTFRSTLTNGPVFGAPRGEPGGFGSLSFDGTNDYVAVGNIAALNPTTTSFSFRLWFKNLTTGTVRFLASKGNGSASATAGWSIFLDSSSVLAVRCADGTAKAAQTVAFTDTTRWHCVDLVIDTTAGTILGYLDGSNAGWSNGGVGAAGNSLSGFTSITTATACDFGRRSDNTSFFTGYTDGFSAWSVARSARQAAQLYAEELAGCPTTLNWLPTKRWFLGTSGGVTTAFPGASVGLSIARAVAVLTETAPGRAVDLSIARAVGVSNLAGSGRAVDLSIVRAPGSIAVPMPGRAVDLTAARGSGGTKIAMPGFSIALSIVAGGTLGTSTQTRAGISVSMSVPRAIGILKAGGTGVVKDLSIARAAAANLSTATGRTVCLTIARGVPVGGATTEARAGYSVGLSVARAVGIEVVPYTWTRTLLGGQAMRARAAYRLEVFDDEDFEIYGTIRSLATLAGARLQFHGYDSTGAVAWDSNAVPPTATVAVTDAAARTYDATSPPKEAGIYRWFITITNTGQVTDAVWGYLTVTKRNAPISSVLQDLLVGDYIR